MGELLIVVAAGEFLHQADALAAGLEFLDGGGSGDWGGGEGIERRSLIFNGEDEFRGSRRAFDGASYGDQLVRLATIAVAHDIRERFFKTELDGELRIGGKGILSGERFDPWPNPGEVIELTFEGQARLGPGGVD